MKNRSTEQRIFSPLVAALKKALEFYGVTCFVAHEDIEPTREWQVEIEKALFSMEALVALLTDGFHQSNWTDQEIGVGIGRGVTIVSVRAGLDPYGFVGKYQGLPAKQKKPTEVAKLLFELLWAKTELQSRLAECIVARLERAQNWDHTNRLMGYLLQLQSISRTLVARIENAAEENTEVRGAFKIAEGLPQLQARAQ